MPSSSTKARVLVADDQPDVVSALSLLLSRRGFDIKTANTPEGVLAAVRSHAFDTALIDLNYARDTTSGHEGLQLLEQLQTIDPQLPIVVMTAWGSVDGAVAALQKGARDYIEKPWKNQRLTAIIAAQVELSQALRVRRRLEGENARLRASPVLALECPSAQMQAVHHLVARVAPSDANILITGEHGTGKEVLARAIHAASRRRERALVTVNAGGLADGVFDSELFGHVKGAFTDAKQSRVGCFELADGGTLFLDEIANMPLTQQSALLRVLQTGEFRPLGSSRVQQSSARIIAATNADLPREVAEGRFREDLLYRLNTIEIEIPALRERNDDIMPLAEGFLQRFAGHYRRAISGFDAAAVRRLLAHDWPGNIRELEHAIERAVLMTDGDHIRARDLALRARHDAAEPMEAMTLNDAEVHLIRSALERNQQNVTNAARDLGLSRSALYRRLARHGLTVP